MIEKAMMKNKKGVLLLGNYRPALVVARKLAKLGFSVMLGKGSGEGGIEYSRFVARCWDHPCPQKSPKVFLSELNRLLQLCPEIQTIVPISEDFVVLLAQKANRLCRDVTLASPDAEIVKKFWKKQSAYEVADKAGVPCLPTALVASHGELLQEAVRVGFPLIVRPVGITARLGHKKAEIIENSDALAALFPDWPVGHNQLLLQRFATGIRHNVYFAADKGSLVGAVESRIFRTDHPDGTGLATDGQTVKPTESLIRDTSALIAATGYSGIGLTQFIIDERSGERCFLELNPRISGSHAVPEAAGLPLTELAVTIANGQYDRGRVSYKTKTGLRYGWTYGDIRGLKSAIAEGEIGIFDAAVWAMKMVVTVIRADFQLSGSISDPVPELVLFGRQVPIVRRFLDSSRSGKTIKTLEEKTS